MMSSNHHLPEARPFMLVPKLRQSSSSTHFIPSQKEALRPDPESPFLKHNTSNMSAVSGKSTKTNDISRTAEELCQEEQKFLETLSKPNQIEDPLSVWSKYHKWCRTHFPRDEEKHFNLLGDLTKSLAQFEKYKQDANYVSKWISYAKLCVDQEEILKYMDENNIGTQLASFYKAYSVIFIRKRKFSKANDWILKGKKKATPTSKMDEFINEFESNMKERLDRDFYSQGKKLKDDDVAEIPVVPSHQENGSEDDDSLEMLLNFQSQDVVNDGTEGMKRKYPFASLGRQKMKKVKLNDLVNSVKLGDFNIYVDPGCREVIPETTRLVNEYDALCYKYNFSIPPPPPEGKYLSWVSQQMPKAETSMSLDVSNTSMSLLKDDSIENPLVAQFQLPKKLRKPLREIKTIKMPSPKPKPAAEPEKQASVPIVPIFDRHSQEITQQYKPKMGPIFEADAYEEGYPEAKDVATTSTSRAGAGKVEAEADKDQDSFDFLLSLARGAEPKQENKRDSMKQVRLPDKVEDSSEHERFNKKIRKTPHVSNKYLGGLDKDDDDEEAEAETGDFNYLNQKERPPPVTTNPQTRPVQGQGAERVVPVNLFSSQSSQPSVARHLSFESLFFNDEEEKVTTEREREATRSPLYRDLFGEDHRKDEGKKKVVVNPKKKFEGNVAKVKESRKRIIPEIYRKDTRDTLEDSQEVSEFERYLFGKLDWKELGTPRRQTQGDDLNELLFSVPRPEYLN